MNLTGAAGHPAALHPCSMFSVATATAPPPPPCRRPGCAAPHRLPLLPAGLLWQQPARGGAPAEGGRGAPPRHNGPATGGTLPLRVALDRARPSLARSTPTESRRCLPLCVPTTQACHLRASAAAGASAALPLAQRSILGGLLPDSLVHMLESYGPDAFAAAVVGDSGELGRRRVTEFYPARTNELRPLHAHGWSLLAPHSTTSCPSPPCLLPTAPPPAPPLPACSPQHHLLPLPSLLAPHSTTSCPSPPCLLPTAPPLPPPPPPPLQTPPSSSGCTRCGGSAWCRRRGRPTAALLCMPCQSTRPASSRLPHRSAAPSCPAPRPRHPDVSGARRGVIPLPALPTPPTTCARCCGTWGTSPAACASTATRCTSTRPAPPQWATRKWR